MGIFISNKDTHQLTDSVFIDQLSMALTHKLERWA